MTIDHLLPQELGGTNETKNLVTCCKSCNSKKGHKSVRQFFAWLRQKGVNTDSIGRRIRRNIKRNLKGNFRI
jgi:5-methylcytosine-specific restriction endonuclease McrA